MLYGRLPYVAEDTVTRSPRLFSLYQQNPGPRAAPRDWGLTATLSPQPAKPFS